MTPEEAIAEMAKRWPELTFIMAGKLSHDPGASLLWVVSALVPKRDSLHRKINGTVFLMADHPSSLEGAINRFARNYDRQRTGIMDGM